jgi:hypothetical protein
MRILEVTQSTTGLTVVVFQGMAHGVAGNRACEQIAQTLDGQAFGPCNDSAQVRANVAAASRYFASRPGTRLVVIGYSKGLEGCVAMQALRPVMTISIAGYPTTLQRDEASIGGRFINFYQQRELDDILRTKHNQGPYKPHAGRAIAVDFDHNKIVPAVMPQVIGLVQSLQP